MVETPFGKKSIPLRSGGKLQRVQKLKVVVRDDAL